MMFHGSSPEAGVRPLRSSDYNGVSSYGTTATREDRFDHLRTAAGDGGGWELRGGLAETCQRRGHPALTP
jgi:hypothetical protein